MIRADWIGFGKRYRSLVVPVYLSVALNNSLDEGDEGDENASGPSVIPSNRQTVNRHTVIQSYSHTVIPSPVFFALSSLVAVIFLHPPNTEASEHKLPT